MMLRASSIPNLNFKLKVGWIARLEAAIPEVTMGHITPPLPLPVPMAMESINRFLYGPTPEQRVQEWQSKLRQESRVLDREMRQVGRLVVRGMYV